MSQAEVSKAMGTSQSAVARIESAQENITVDTLQRLIVALNGRFHVSIQPQEYPEQPQKRPWWEVARRVESGWTVVRIEGLRNSQTDQFIVGLERPHGLYTTSPIALSKAGMLHEGKTKG
jgi:transcriptional regulator with XRE-family HTH domain